MTPFIRLCQKDPLFTVSCIILGMFVVIILQIAVLIGRQCADNVRNTHKYLRGIICGLCGIKLEDKEPDSVKNAKPYIDENGVLKYAVETRKGKILKSLVTYDPDVILDPYCRIVRDGKKRLYIVISNDDNPYRSIAKAINSVL